MQCQLIANSGRRSWIFSLSEKEINIEAKLQGNSGFIIYQKRYQVYLMPHFNISWLEFSFGSHFIAYTYHIDFIGPGEKFYPWAEVGMLWLSWVRVWEKRVTNYSSHRVDFPLLFWLNHMLMWKEP